MGRKSKGYTKKDFENTFIEILENENKLVVEFDGTLVVL